MNVSLVAFESGGSDSVVYVVNNKKEACITHDQTTHMDANWLNGMCGSVGENICEEELFACFPDRRNWSSMGACLQKLHVLQNSALVILFRQLPAR